MTNNPITLTRFSRILEAYGADSERWPAAERPGAETLLAQSEEAQQLRDEAAALDTLLDAAPAPAPASHRLRMRLVEAARRHMAAAAPAPRVYAGEGSFAADEPPRPEPARTRLGRAVMDMLAELGGLRPAGAALAASLVLGVAAGGFVMPVDDTGGDLDVVELALLSDTFEGY